MMMDVYFQKMKETLGVIERTQRKGILQAAKAVADSLENNGMWHVLDTGHMLMHEAVGRTFRPAKNPKIIRISDDIHFFQPCIPAPSSSPS